MQIPIEIVVAIITALSSAVAALFYLLRNSYEQRLKDKDKEIEELSKELGELRAKLDNIYSLALSKKEGHLP